MLSGFPSILGLMSISDIKYTVGINDKAQPNTSVEETEARRTLGARF